MKFEADEGRDSGKTRTRKRGRAVYGSGLENRRG